VDGLLSGWLAPAGDPAPSVWWGPGRAVRVAQVVSLLAVLVAVGLAVDPLVRRRARKRRRRLQGGGATSAAG
jgi:hypothetical protein